MDPAQDSSQYPYDALSQLQYPASTPSVLSLSEEMFLAPNYTIRYEHPPITPIPVNPNFGTYTHTPTPTRAISPPLQGLASVTTTLSDSALSSFTLKETIDDVLISTVFHPGNQPTPNTILFSSDRVLFYVHYPTLSNLFPDVFQPSSFVSLSCPSFDGILIQAVDAPSDQLNIILHALYSISPAAHSPSFDTLIAAVDRMQAYRISPELLIRPSTPIYELLLSYAPLRPLELYALGACHNLHSLAVRSSSYLLTYNLTTITDYMAERIGAVYLKKILLLHVERFASLKRILLHPPHPHQPIKTCTFKDQSKLTRAWALVSANLAWDVRPDLSTNMLKSALNPLMENSTCEMCHQALQDKIKNVMVQWSSVKHYLRACSVGTSPVDLLL